MAANVAFGLKTAVRRSGAHVCFGSADETAPAVSCCGGVDVAIGNGCTLV
jgi:hypothetical protein